MGRSGKRGKHGRRAGARPSLLLSLVSLAAIAVLGGCTLIGGWFESAHLQSNGAAVTSVDFGAVEVGAVTPATETLTIANTGSLPLDYGGSGAFTVTGDAAGDFAVGSFSATKVDGGAGLTFTVTFSPTTTGTRTATLTVQPLGGAPQSVTLSGYGGSGQIIVSDTTDMTTATIVSAGGTWDYGTTYQGAGINVFVTNNSTLSDLTLDSTVTVSSADGAFSLALAPQTTALAKGGTSTYFQLIFSPDPVDTVPHSATITIGNSATGSFTFTITATSTGMLG